MIVVREYVSQSHQEGFLFMWNCGGKKQFYSAEIDAELVSNVDDLHMTVASLFKVASDKLHNGNNCPDCLLAYKELLDQMKNNPGKYTPYNEKSGFIKFDSTNYTESLNKLLATAWHTEKQWLVYQKAPAPSTYAGQDRRYLSAEAEKLPGMNVKVKSPCSDCLSSKQEASIYGIVIHLNDAHKWTREEIADWLDSVHDPEQGIDLAFKVPEKEES